jgi:hypothetical protein
MKRREKDKKKICFDEKYNGRRNLERPAEQ